MEELRAKQQPAGIEPATLEALEARVATLRRERDAAAAVAGEADADDDGEDS